MSSGHGHPWHKFAVGVRGMTAGELGQRSSQPGVRVDAGDSCSFLSA